MKKIKYTNLGIWYESETTQAKIAVGHRVASFLHVGSKIGAPKQQPAVHAISKPADGWRSERTFRKGGRVYECDG